VAIATEPVSTHARSFGERTPVATRLLVGLIVALAASPIVIAALALLGDPWVPLSDWASLVFRVSQVGGGETPLVGPYSFHGFAHPGPFLYWLAAPLYRLTDGDPRSLLWSGAIVNVGAVVAIAAVAWRRGRWPLLLGAMVLVVLLVHGVGPDALADLWNPYVALLPFVLTLFLAWDAALGRQRALVEAVVPATFAMQSHLAFLTLVALVAVWLFAWARWSPALLGGTAAVEAGQAAAVDRPPVADARTERRALLSRTSVRAMAVIAGLLWLPPLLDALFGQHNPVNIARSLASPRATVGALDGGAIVGSYIGPNSAWVTGNHSILWLSVSRTHMLTLVAVLGVLVGCLVVARRRRLDDAVALASLSAVLVIGSVPATARLIDDPPPYLAEWLKVVGGFVWFSVGWTAWRLAGTPARGRTVALGLAGVALLGGAAWSWGTAAATSPPHDERPALVHDIRAALREHLADGDTYRVDVVGDVLGHHQGLFYWMIKDGHDVVTTDGADGLKWGRDHVWHPGDEVDARLTVAVHYGNSFSTAYDECARDPDVLPIFVHTDLGPDDRAWLESVNLRRVGDAGSVSDDENERWDQLAARDFRIAVFEGDTTCGEE
jgi:hypothetical protein